MTDEGQPTPDQPRPVPQNQPTVDEFRKRLADRGIDALACPACGTDDAWGGTMDAALNIIEGRDPKTGQVDGIMGSVHAIAATCGSCGYIVLFDREVIGG